MSATQNRGSAEPGRCSTRNTVPLESRYRAPATVLISRRLSVSRAGLHIQRVYRAARQLENETGKARRPSSFLATTGDRRADGNHMETGEIGDPADRVAPALRVHLAPVQLGDLAATLFVAELPHRFAAQVLVRRVEHRSREHVAAGARVRLVE
jgi:hypothetical protein